LWSLGASSPARWASGAAAPVKWIAQKADYAESDVMRCPCWPAAVVDA
jgi:hypothetical protein